MTTATDRKIMMLNRIVTRAHKQLKTRNLKILNLEETIKTHRSRIKILMERLRGNGGLTPIPDEYQECYEYTLNFVMCMKYKDKSKIAMFKDVKLNESRPLPNTIRGQIVLDWLVHKIDEGLYDLELVNQWPY